MSMGHYFRRWPSVVAGALVLGLAAAQASEAESCAGTICVEQAWARAMPGGAQNAAVYFMIVNKGPAADTLRAASAEGAGSAMIHRSVVGADNVVRMDMVGAVEIAPGARVTFGPTGYHVMLGGVKQRLTEGTTIPITLQFARAGKLTTPVRVLRITATRPGSATQADGLPSMPAGEHAHH